MTNYNFDVKKTISFLRQELKKELDYGIKAKRQYKLNQRLFTKIFLNNSFNPNYWDYYNGELCQWAKETEENYNLRKTLLKEYIEKGGDKTFGMRYPISNYYLTSLYVLYNTLRNKKRPHTRNDESYKNTSVYKELLQRMESLFPLLSSSQETQGEDSNGK